MTSLGRLIFFDQPGTGASDPITSGAMPTLEQWATASPRCWTISAVAKRFSSPSTARWPPERLFAATHPSRTAALVVLEGYADTTDASRPDEGAADAMVAMWGTGEFQHVVNPDMPWNEEIRAAWARMERLAASPRRSRSCGARAGNGRAGRASLDPRAHASSSSTPTIDDHACDGQDVADHIPDAKYVELPGRNMYHFVEPWRDSFQEIAEFLTGHQAEVADDRVLATVLFTDIVGSTRMAAEIGDSNWRALLDAHDAVVRSQLARFRGREVNTSGDGFLATFDGPQRAIRCAMAIRDAVQPLGIEVRAGLAHRRMRTPRRRHRRHRRTHRCPRQRARRARTTCSCPAHCATWSSVQASSSTTAAPTNSRVCPANGTCSPSRRSATTCRAPELPPTTCRPTPDKPRASGGVRLRPTGSDPPAPRKAVAYRRIRHPGQTPLR